MGKDFGAAPLQFFGRTRRAVARSSARGRGRRLLVSPALLRPVLLVLNVGTGRRNCVGILVFRRRREFSRRAVKVVRVDTRRVNFIAIVVNIPARWTDGGTVFGNNNCKWVARYPRRVHVIFVTCKTIFEIIMVVSEIFVPVFHDVVVVCHFCGNTSSNLRLLLLLKEFVDGHDT